MNSHNLFTKGKRNDGKRSARTHETVCSKDHQTLCCLTLTWCGQGLGMQVLKAGTSPGAQYREAQRAKSDADFISKIEGALQELDETVYWLELLGESEILPQRRLEPLRQEAEELMAILITIVLNIKRRGRRRVN